ncbi:glycoside hydrolase family 3 protein [Pleurostoma richardsiae]|uniref:xylan 1,4-beta-xylosidase n=1 Tax=Pleurostoma richardsiae TaxID=41990 RepID=A0AA38RH20_9PEZI|nr:glycoside hydrolase family 3 protein [Pleurostoma richardsiae]
MLRTVQLLGGLTAMAFNADAAFPDCVSGPLANNGVCDASLDPLTRARALIGEFTVGEKLNNTGSTSRGIPRLGVPPYTWWQEALHGVALSPGVNFSAAGDYSYATSFPQPILMGAAFDDDLIQAVATVISTEARSFSNVGRAGLDFWTPNINPFRDPRWGRGQETPGEDSFHLSSYVRALIDGLQGGYDPKYKRIIATCKHFVGYDMESWNGNYRYQWDAPISMQDMVEYYMPPFRSCARDSNVGAFMCSYNSVNGVPTCADPWLLNDVLRKHWGWTNEEQWVTSDCDAVQNVFLPHEWAKTREEAAALSLIAGTDVNCGTYYQNHLPAAYAQGLINDTILDKALIRQYSSLVRLGYFDRPENQPYRALNFTNVSTPHAEQLAYRAAVEGIVLLKNEGMLPLDLSGNRTIALVGDWANATEQMQGNYFGQPPFLHSPLYAAQQLTTVYYVNGPGQGDPTTDNWLPVWSTAAKADIIIYVGGIDNSVESEGMDRVSIAWTGAQLDVIGQLAEYGKPMAVVQMGGGQIDSTPIKDNPNISSLLWAGYPGQDGGTAIFDIITGNAAPAGRLPVTQYPASYIAQVPMTDMTLRPGPTSPGRTYKWYNGREVYPFGYGLHYTNFTASIDEESFGPRRNMSFSISSLFSSCNASSNKPQYIDRCPFVTLSVNVRNTGNQASDYVALLFSSGEFGPRPYPLKSLVAYTRAHNISAGGLQTVGLNLTLGSLARVDDRGNTVLYPGDYSLMLDLQPLATANFTLTGKAVVLDYWPQPPANRKPVGVPGLPEGYFTGGFGSTTGPEQKPVGVKT